MKTFFTLIALLSVAQADIFSSVLNFKSSEISEVNGPPPQNCTSDNCKLPKCFCSGTAIPGGLARTETPQMISLTFQNAVRREDMALYKQLFQNRPNPSGCPVTGTFFVSHQSTDYYSVQELASLRHEIGVNSITFRSPQSWWAGASKKDWSDEMGGESTILSNLANISHIEGERAPFLQMGGDSQFQAIKKDKLKYDASRVSIQFSQSPNLLWPYTYDYRSIQDCVVPPCPEDSHKGIWQVPLLALKDKNGNYCSTADACDVTTLPEAFALFRRTFDDHYFSNRAPIVLALSAAWLRDPTKLLATQLFLQYVRGLTDVYVIPVQKIIEWIQDPTPVASLPGFKPWQCAEPAPYLCSEQDSIHCQYDENRRIVNTPGYQVVTYSTYTCLTKCPKCYPWVNDPEGKKC